jgi:hypothetical protein
MALPMLFPWPYKILRAVIHLGKRSFACAKAIWAVLRKVEGGWSAFQIAGLPRCINAAKFYIALIFGPFHQGKGRPKS